MKKTKIMLVVAFVCAIISFGAATANAQTTVPVTVTSLSDSYPAFATEVSYRVTLVNNATTDQYVFQTSSSNINTDGTYHVGDIPTGTYTVSVAYIESSFWQSYFDWNANAEYGYNVSMYNDTDLYLSDNVVVNDIYSGGNYGLEITMYRY